MGLKDKVSEKQLQALADLGLLNVGQKNDPSQTTFNAQTMHGINSGGYDGLMSDVGYRDDFYTAMPRVRSFSKILNFYKSQYENDRVFIMTGQRATDGTNATSWCATSAPTPGDLKICRQYYPYGAFRMMTRLNQVPTAGGYVDRADTPKILKNNPAVQSRFVPDLLANFPNSSARELQVQLFQMGIAFERAFERVAIQGSRLNTGSNGELGFFEEFDGLDQLIKTGYQDVVTSTACPAADSMVITFGAEINGTVSGGDGRNIVDVLTDLVYGGQDRARQLGLVVEYAIIVRQELFRALTDVWACQYNTSRCELINTNDRRVVDAVASNQLRIDLLTGYYLLVDGVMYPVLISEGIEQGGGVTANSFTQDLYLVPLTVNGEDVTYMEYFDMGNEVATEMMRFPAGEFGILPLNNGLFLASAMRNAFCYEYHFASRPRMILRTPFLAGRVDNITFSFRAPVRSPYPDESFYANGGGTFVDR